MPRILVYTEVSHLAYTLSPSPAPVGDVPFPLLLNLPGLCSDLYAFKLALSSTWFYNSVVDVPTSCSGFGTFAWCRFGDRIVFGLWPTNPLRPITSDVFLKGGNGLAAVSLLFNSIFDLSALLSLCLGDLAFDDLGLFDFGSDLGDLDDFYFKTLPLGLFGDMARFGDLDFILPDC